MFAYADSSFASKMEDKKWVSGGVVLHGGTAVTLLFRTQIYATLSSTEAEYVAIGEYAKKALFLREALGYIQRNAEVIDRHSCI